jgi:hypothetical protein
MARAHVRVPIALALAVATAAAIAGQTRTQPRPLPNGAFAQNVDYVGFTNVNGHFPFKIDIQQANGRWYMYAGAQNDRGWSVLDVTDPAKPSVLNWIPGPPNTRTGELDIADGRMITPLERSQMGGDTDPKKPWDEGVLIWSLADPVHPVRLGQYKTGGLGTHRDGYFGGRYMHLAAAMNGYSGQIYVIVDIADPAHPVEVSRWALPELKLKDPNALNTAYPHGHGLHGPPVVVGNLAYLPFGTKFVILDISDVRHPREVSELTFDPPFHGLFAVHTALPFPSRKIVETNSEANCEDGASQASLIDVADPAKPKIIAFFPEPVPPPGAPYKNFCDKSPGFGAHNVNMLFHNPFVDHADNIVYMTWVNAGLHIYDIADARHPREIGYFIPPDPPVKPGTPAPAAKVVTDSADVLVDTRGYIYLSDRKAGMYVLKYTGPKPGPALPLHASGRD